MRQQATILAVGAMIALAIFLGLWQPWGGGDDARTVQIIPPASTLVPTLPMDTPTQAPRPTVLLDRRDCNEVRGTDYRSPSERTWFLDNCITPVVAQLSSQPPTQDDAPPPIQLLPTPSPTLSGEEAVALVVNWLIQGGAEWEIAGTWLRIPNAPFDTRLFPRSCEPNWTGVFWQIDCIAEGIVPCTSYCFNTDFTQQFCVFESTMTAAYC